MKTPIQQLIEEYQRRREEGDNDMRTVIYLAEEMLEKEKEAMKKCIVMGMEFIPVDPNFYEEDSELLFNANFNTKEK